MRSSIDTGITQAPVPAAKNSAFVTMSAPT
jgi:hypothetical protein